MPNLGSRLTGTPIDTRGGVEGESLVVRDGVFVAESGRGGGGVAFSGARVIQTSDQTGILNATFTLIKWDVADYDTDSYFDNANDKFVVPTAGKYLIVATISSLDVDNDDFILSFHKNGVLHTPWVRLSGPIDAAINFTSVLDLAAGDDITVVGYATAGTWATLAGRCEFTITRLSGGAGGGLRTAGLTVELTGDQAIATAGEFVDWDQVDADSDAPPAAWNIANADRLVAWEDGWYVVTGHLEWETGVSAGDIWIHFERSTGGGFFGLSRFDAAGTNFQPAVGSASPVFLNVGDYVRVFAGQDSGSSKDLKGGLSRATLMLIPGGGGGSVSGAEVRLTSAQSNANSTWEAITWDAEDYDDDDFWTLSPNPERITFPAADRYLVVVNVIHAASSGTLYIRLLRNGVAAAELQEISNGAASTGDTRTQLTCIVDAGVGDYVTAEAFQSSGSALDIRGASGVDVETTRLQVFRLTGSGRGDALAAAAFVPILMLGGM